MTRILFHTFKEWGRVFRNAVNGKRMDTGEEYGERGNTWCKVGRTRNLRFEKRRNSGTGPTSEKGFTKRLSSSVLQRKNSKFKMKFTTDKSLW